MAKVRTKKMSRASMKWLSENSTKGPDGYCALPPDRKPKIIPKPDKGYIMPLFIRKEESTC